MKTVYMMKRETTWRWLCLLTMAVLLTGKPQGSKALDLVNPQDLSPAEWQEQPEEDSVRGERLFAYYTSTSVTRLVTTTITAISTCLSTIGTPACTGRNRKNHAGASPKPDEDPDIELELEPSLLNVEDTVEEVKGEVRSGRKLTIWSTAFTTITITSTSPLAGTTVTASLLCAVPGFGASCFLG